MEELTVLIQLKETMLVKVFLANLEGKIVMAYPEQTFPAGIQSIVFKNKNLKPGVYLCQIQTRLGNQVRKVVINPE